MAKVAEYRAVGMCDEVNVRRKMRLVSKLKDIEAQIREIVTRPENIVPFLVSGRVIHVKTETDDWGWGILAGFTKQRLKAKNKETLMKSKHGDHLSDIVSRTEQTYILDVYLYSSNKLTTDGTLQPGNPKLDNGRLGLVPIVLSSQTLHEISTI